MGPLIAVGIAAAAVTVSAHEGDPLFAARQQHPTTLSPAAVEARVLTVREPVPSGHGSPARRARCAPGARGEFKNPWRCEVKYVSGAVVRYTVTVDPDGQVLGDDATGVRHIRSCCIPLSGA